MQKLSDLNLIPVWVTPSHRAMSAKVLMQGHLLKSLPVMEGGEIVGLVSLERALAASDEAEVRSILNAELTVMDGSTTLVKAAQVFVDRQIEIAAVVDGGQLQGMVTVHALLRELRRTWDPLTGLGWSDRLREWGSEMLTSGREISIIFVDINRFGDFNKKYGHIVGDRVLQRVAQVLRSEIDPNRDVVVRYGGDEFAIGTPRPYEEADQLRDRLILAGQDLQVGEDGHAISYSIGIGGGRRTKLREDAHIPSMLDEIINNASRDALARKPKAAEASRLEVVTNTPEVAPITINAPTVEPPAFRPRFDP